MTGTIQRQIDEVENIIDSADIILGNFEKVRTGFSVIFKSTVSDHGGDSETRSFSEIVNPHKKRMINSLKNYQTAKQSMKIKMRLEIIYKKPDYGFDGEVSYQYHKAHLSGKLIKTITKTNLESTIEELLE